MSADARSRRSATFGSDGWYESFACDLLDHRVSVHSDSEALIALVEDLFHAVRTDAVADRALYLGRATGPDGPGWYAADEATVLVRSTAPGVAFRHLVFAANQAAIDHTRGVRMHAAAAVGGGGAVVLPGAMGAGKSTLAAALVRRGWAYLSDEVAAFDGAGAVRPYAKPVSLGVPPAALGTWEWGPSADGAPFLATSGLIPPRVLGPVGVAPAPLGAVVLPSYEPGVPTVLRELAPADALVAVSAHVFGLDEPGMLAAVARVLADRPCFSLRSGDLSEACDAVIDATAGTGL